MAVTHLKHGKPEAERAEDDARVRMSVEGFLADIAARGDVAEGMDLATNALQ